jgi:putative membrane protein
MGGMGLWWLIGLAIVVGLGWWIARMSGPSGAPNAADASPETLLKRRYARGEIDREDYERRLADLRE